MAYWSLILEGNRGTWPVSREFYTFLNHMSSLKELSKFDIIINFSNSLTMIHGIMVRLLCAHNCLDKRSIFNEISMKDYEVTDSMMFVMLMEETNEMFSTQNLSGLAFSWKGGVCWTQGGIKHFTSWEPWELAKYFA